MERRPTGFLEQNAELRNEGDQVREDRSKAGSGLQDLHEAKDEEESMSSRVHKENEGALRHSQR